MPTNIDTRQLRQLPNLGPKSEQMLYNAGITTPEQLKQLGPVKAYLRVKQTGLKPSLNLLYAIAGALSNTHWNKLSPEERCHLLMELEDYQEND